MENGVGHPVPEVAEVKGAPGSKAEWEATAAQAEPDVQAAQAEVAEVVSELDIQVVVAVVLILA
jgi:hypothetical protein